MDLVELKIWVVRYSGLDQDALHIHVAIILYLLFAAIFRPWGLRLLPWLLILAIELVNEGYDLAYQAETDGPPRWNESLKDVWNTMLWPTVLLLVSRYTSLLAPRRPAVAEPRLAGRAEPTRPPEV